jgi:hypothetical protein
MDADDVAFPERLALQMQYLDAHPEVDVLGGAAIDCDAASRPIGLRAYPTTHDEIRRLIWTNPFIHPTVLYRRDAIRAVGSYDVGIRKRQDYDLWFRCMEGGLQLANLAEPLIKYRVTEDYYRKNDLRVAWDQVRIGWRGCRRVHAGPLAYVGVTTPFVRSLLPRRLNQFVHLLLHKVDPRRQAVSHVES